jgi:hypothetical protein
MPLTAGIIDNRRNHFYYKPRCCGAAVMSEKNRVTFTSEADAEEAHNAGGGAQRARAHNGDAAIFELSGS